MKIFGEELIFKPIIPLTTMIVFTSILLLIVILNRKHIIVRIIILALLFIISQRPMLLNGEDITYNLDLDIIFVIDNTASMNAIDVNNDTRMKAVINDCKNIMDTFPGSSFAVITFGNYAQVRAPFSNDNGLINGIIDTLKVIDPIYGAGTTLDLPFDSIKKFLESSQEKEKHKRILFFMTDGELTNQEKLSNNFSKYNSIKDMIDNGAVLGYGTEKGAKIRIVDSVNQSTITDSEGYLLENVRGSKSLAISKMDEKNLKDLAASLSLDYYHMTNTSVLSNKLMEIRDEAIENEEDTEYSNKDLYYYFSFALLIVLLYELFYYRRREQWRRK